MTSCELVIVLKIICMFGLSGFSYFPPFSVNICYVTFSFTFSKSGSSFSSLYLLRNEKNVSWLSYESVKKQMDPDFVYVINQRNARSFRFLAS